MNVNMMIRGAAMVAILGIAPGAMAKTLQALLSVGTRPQGTTFLTCGSNSLWAQASGWDSSGNLKCLVRQFSNHLWISTSNCPATATHENISLRSTGASFCASPKSPWGGGEFCSVGNMFLKPNGAPCVNVGTVNVFSHTTH